MLAEGLEEKAIEVLDVGKEGMLSFKESMVGLVELGKQGVVKAVEILKEQVPDLVNQILRWEFAVGLMWFCFGLALFGLILKYNEKVWKTANGSDDDDFGFFVGVLWIMAYIGAAAVCIGNLTWLKILLAPKLFLIEYITKLIK